MKRKIYKPVEKGTISVAMVKEALQGAIEMGHGPTDLLRMAGLPEHLLDDPRARVSVDEYARLWRQIAVVLDDEFFAMDPRRMRDGSFAFFCRTAMMQPTVGEGVALGLEFLALIFEHKKGKLVRRDSVAEIVLVDEPKEPARAFSYFTYWLFVHGLACWLACRRIPIIAAESRCAAPEYTDDYRVMFSESLLFNKKRTRIVFAADCLDLPIKRTEEELADFLALAPANILVRYRDPNSLTGRIRRLFTEVSPEQWPDLTQLAHQLHMSSSTLRRRLQEEGQSFQSIKDSLRKEWAVEWLAREDVSFEDVAEHLGFSDVSSFYKAFRKWTGTQPGHYRSLILEEQR